jgi:tetratricopeptide (TPR) repeat protein
MEISRDADVRAFLSFTGGSLGNVQILMGRYDLALQILVDAVRPENLNVSVVPPVYTKIAMAEALSLAGRNERAMDIAQEALNDSRERGELAFAAWALYVMAKIETHDHMNRMEQGTHRFREALDQAVELRMRPLQAHCRLSLGRLHLRNGRTEDARTEIEAAMELYLSMDMYLWVPKAEAALAEITKSATR